jgi:hypothetical protein
MTDHIELIIAAIAVGGLIFNSGVLYNDVKHIKADGGEIKKHLYDLVKKTKI